MPVVLLESISTGRRAWFANFHNPADTPNLGNNARWRAEAAAIEVAHLTELHQADGTPVIATGDYNERAEIFCRFTAGGVFAGGSGRQLGRRLRPAAEHAGRLGLRLHRTSPSPATPSPERARPPTTAWCTARRRSPGTTARPRSSTGTDTDGEGQ